MEQDIRNQSEEGSLQRFLTLGYAMGPEQFFVSITATMIMAHAFAVISTGLANVLILLIWLGLSSARLLDAGLWRISALFTAIIPAILLLHAFPLVSTGLDLPTGALTLYLYFWIVAYFCLAALPGSWRLTVVPIALVQNYFSINVLVVLGGLRNAVAAEDLAVAGACVAYVLLSQLLLLLLPSRSRNRKIGVN